MLYYTTLDEIAALPPNQFLRDAFCNNPSSLLDLPTEKQSRAAIAGGYLPAVERAERYIREIETALTELPQTGSFATIRSPFGSRVSVGDWISNSPAPCRRRVKRVFDTTPIKIVVGNFVSRGVSGKTYARRSEAVIAFLLLVQRYRPVDLFCSLESMNESHTESIFGLIPLDSRPINLSQTGYVIGHPAFSRMHGYASLMAHGVKDPIPHPRADDRESRKTLGLTDMDIYIQSTVLNDPLISDPIKWIKNQLAKITQQTGE